MRTSLLVSAAILTLPGAALADEAAGGSEPSILVIGESEGYLTIDSATATKTDTPLLDVPQTINAVTREQIDDQAHRSLADVLRYVPGVTIGQGEGNRDQITLHGQNTTADFFLDGVRDDVQYFRNLYNIERVEVLKGPYALIFGRGGGGGIINRVQKASTASRRHPLPTGSSRAGKPASTPSGRGRSPPTSIRRSRKAPLSGSTPSTKSSTITAITSTANATR